MKPPVRALGVLAAAFLVTLTAAVPAAAAPGVPVPLEFVHAEVVPLGQSTLTASFTDWPIRAGRSLDFTFAPAEGIAGRTGKLDAVAPSGEVVPLGIPGLLAGDNQMELTRHPRDRAAWGLDVVALPQEGLWHFEFTIDGPTGRSTATLPITVTPRPGPPLILSWVVAMLPWAAAATYLAYRWGRTRSSRRGDSLTWHGSPTV